MVMVPRRNLGWLRTSRRSETLYVTPTEYQRTNVVNFELSCELIKGHGILIPFERLNPKYSDHALLFSFFFFMGDNFFFKLLTI